MEYNTNMSSDCQQLYELAHKALHLGEDGSPVYADEFARLNTEVFRTAELLFPVKGVTPEEEAEICVSLLLAYSAVIEGTVNLEEHRQAILDRSSAILDQLPASLLKCRLLLYCYGEVFVRELLEQAREIMIGWGGRELTDEEKEMLELHNTLLENPNSKLPCNNIVNLN
ncbi:MAG: UpxZ family transcription anti-terminator antagonist [Bacteroides sp.]|nr:UpxZ family transcription anti-terminator antagonist [Bacteroides sp.]